MNSTEPNNPARPTEATEADSTPEIAKPAELIEPSGPIEPTLTRLLDAEALDATITRMAGEILERHPSPGEILLAGIPTRGVEVARRLAGQLAQTSGQNPALGSLDISMHRDDLSLRPRMTAMQTTDLPVDIDGRTVILVDDVLYTGRSIRAALDALSSYGRPGHIELAVLIDRGHRQLPIQPDYVGYRQETLFTDRIRVRFANLDTVPDAVHLVRPRA
jgi:pyrimidine operon attenuation protein/uracil phosphoribosyltransferase